MRELDHFFFFSYASANHANAKWERQGNTGNYLDEFFDALCREVSDRTGRRADRVAYRDRNRLKMSDFWDQGLVEGLQRSRVLLCLISPHYLQSDNCGRELGFFNRREEERIKITPGSITQAHRILPLFWQNSELCFENVSPGIVGFLKRYNFTQQGMPPNYPAVGLSQITKLRSGTDYERLCQSLAQRIVELAGLDPPLPELTGQGDFSDLESIYSQLQKEAEEDLVLSGPVGANVLYVVGTRAEMESAGVVRPDMYAEKREEWCPFPEAPGATVELLTKEGALSIGLKEFRNFGLPSNLAPLIEAAKQRNSPVLLVLDRSALSLPNVVARMSEYASQNFENCGLVTAGGNEVPDERIGQVFKFKYIPNYPHHVWNAPETREAYVSSVAFVLSGIKNHLMTQGRPVTPLTSTAIPGILGPSGD